MREILFRGKRTESGEWVEGYLTCRPSPIQYGAHYSPWFIDAPPRDPDGNGYFYRVDGKTVGEFTGLTDKNGTPIFEGDIMHLKEFNIKGMTYSAHNYEVIFKDGYFMLSRKGRATRGVAVWHDMGEVIGNIHDNPELIERGNEERSERE